MKARDRADRGGGQPHAPFSRPLAVTDVPDEGMTKDIAADPAEAAAVAAAIGLPAVETLSARLNLSWQPGRRLHVDGHVQARITQVCVVSLDPFESDVVQDVDVDFVEPKVARVERPGRQRDGRAALRQAVEAPPPPPTDGEDEPPDPIVDGRIDLGAIAVEFLTLALDFYPRKPGVEFHDVVIGDGDDPQASAFAALARLKDRS